MLTDELHRFFIDDHVEVLDTQRRLVRFSRNIKKIRLP